jgi:uncharacterized SAM-binding protein YcdF (DUF218 family)
LCDKIGAEFAEVSPVKKLRLKSLRWAAVSLVGLLIGVLLIIPVRLAIAARQAPHPQAILALGGNPDREAAAAQLARHYPALEVWVSTGETPQKAQEAASSAYSHSCSHSWSYWHECCTFA